MSEQERMLNDLWNAVKGTGYGTGLEYEFVTFKTEILTTMKNTSVGVKASNERMNIIIGALGLIVAIGILLCAIFTIALTHTSARSMLMTNRPIVTASSDASMPDDVQ